MATSARWLRNILCLLAFTYAVFFLLLAARVGPHDYNHLSGYYEIAWRFWKTQVGLPQFNPFHCGGRTLGGDPQIPIFHPLTFLVGILGPSVVLRWEMLFQVLLGGWGMSRLLRFFDLADANRFWGVLLFVAGGGVVARFEVGHVTLGFLFLFPLFLWLSYELATKKEWTPCFCGYLLLFIYCGLYKPNFFAYGVPLLAIEVTARSIFQRNLKPLLFFIGATAVAAGVDAISLWPAHLYFERFPRTSAAEPKWTSPGAFLANVLMPLRTIPKAWYGTAPIQRHEYNIFIGPFGVLFAYLAVRARVTRPEVKALLVWAACSFILGLGSTDAEFHLYSPYSWLTSAWPGFHTLRAPTRMWFGAFTALTILSAIGFKDYQWGWRQTLFWSFGVLPLVASAGVNLSKTFFISEQWQGRAERVLTAPILQTKLSHPDLGLDELRAGRGILDCVDNIQAYRAPLLEEDALSVTTKSTALTRAQWAGWSRIELEARTDSPIRIALNLNHSDQWRWEGSPARIDSHNGQPLAIQASDGDLKGTLIFEQPGVTEAARVSGLTASLTATGIAIALWRKRRRKVKASP